MNDEIDVRILALRVIHRWATLLIVLFYSVLGIIVFFSYDFFKVNKVAVQDIRLFGIDDKYPNGTPFSVTDFLEPQILVELFKSAGVAGLTPEEQLQAVSVTQSRNDTALITAKYNAKAEAIGSEKDSFAQLQALGLQRDEELAASNKGVYTLQVNYEQFGISKETATIMLLNWPRIWESYVVRKYRVVTDLSLKSMALVNDSDLASPAAAYYARQQLDYVRTNIETFAGDPRFRRRESTNGRTPIEILRGIDEYDRVLFTPLYSSILSIDSPLSEFYLSDKKLRIEQLDKQIVSLQTVVDDITKLEVGVRNESGRSSNGDGDIIQIGDGTLNDIVGLVQKASLQDFLTATLERRHDLVVEKTEVEKSLAQISGNKLLSPEFIQTVSDIYSDIMDEYGQLLVQAETLALDSRIQMFEPKQDAAFIGSRLHPKFKIAPLAVVIALMLCCMVMVAMPTKRERREEERRQEEARRSLDEI